mgnify:CR=1 FL=1|jgi:hypothetical protein
MSSPGNLTEQTTSPGVLNADDNSSAAAHCIVSTESKRERNRVGNFHPDWFTEMSPLWPGKFYCSSLFHAIPCVC